MTAFFRNNWIHIATGAFFVLIAITLFGIAMSRGLNRDENQFIAAGALFARQGLLPYRDYPYFHVPNLLFIYAALFRCSNYLLLTSRLFSVLCAVASLVIIYSFAARRLAHLSRGARFVIAAAVTICAFANPLFRYTYWRAWNHSFPVLLTMLAFLCYLESRARARPAGWLFATGLLTSLAVGTRLTFAPVAFAFLLVILCADLRRPAWRKAGWFCAGFALAILPTLVLFSLAPDQFIFGNLTYNSELYPGFCAGNGLGKEMTLGFKLRYCATRILANPGNAALVVGVAYFFIRSRGWQICKGSWSLLLLICALFFGGFAAAIPLPQYFYAPVPLIALGLAMAISRTRPIARRDYLLLSLITIVCIASTIIDFRYSVRLFQQNRWSTLKVHSTGCRLAAATGKGKVLSLAPIFPLEGGLQIYPELTAEPFAFRNGSALPAAERLRQKMLGPDELPALLAEQPPKGILVGTEPLVEGPVIGFAKTRDYRPEPIGLGLTVFLPDARSADVAKAPATASDETSKILLQRNQLKRSARPSASKPTNEWDALDRYLDIYAEIIANIKEDLRSSGSDRPNPRVAQEPVLSARQTTSHIELLQWVATKFNCRLRELFAEFEHGGVSGWVEELDVTPAWRGQGIASRLLGKVISTAKELGGRPLDLEVDAAHERAISLYQRYHFLPHSRSRFYLTL